MDGALIGLIGLFVIWFIGVPVLIKIVTIKAMKKEHHGQGILKGFIHEKNIEQIDARSLDLYNDNGKNYPVVELEIDSVKYLKAPPIPTSILDDSHIGSLVPVAYDFIKDGGELRVYLNDEKTIKKRKMMWLRGLYFSIIMTIAAVVYLLVERVFR